MAASYFAQSMTAPASFDLSVRRLPATRRFLVAAGLDDALAYFRFTGEVWAMPEGSVCFPQEPMLRVTAPMIEAQIVETALLCTVVEYARGHSSRRT